MPHCRRARAAGSAAVAAWARCSDTNLPTAMMTIRPAVHMSKPRPFCLSPSAKRPAWNRSTAVAPPCLRLAYLIRAAASTLRLQEATNAGVAGRGGTPSGAITTRVRRAVRASREPAPSGPPLRRMAETAMSTRSCAYGTFAPLPPRSCAMHDSGSSLARAAACFHDCASSRSSTQPHCLESRGRLPCHAPALSGR